MVIFIVTTVGNITSRRKKLRQLAQRPLSCGVHFVEAKLKAISECLVDKSCAVSALCGGAQLELEKYIDPSVCMN